MGSARYRLIRTLATGGMAQVLEAVRDDGGEDPMRVALKRILPELADDAAMQRMFLDEARVASALDHPCIARVLDFGEIDGAAFLVSELIDGLDLSMAIARAGAVPEGVARRIAIRVAEALAYLEERGVVHRDVSPQNILLGRDGRVALADFGIALDRDRGWRTTAGVVKGKRAYMAPEQARGEVVTSASDVYALGLTVEAMRRGVEPDTMWQAETETWPPIVEALRDDPEARPAASRLVEQLEPGAAGDEALARWMGSLPEAAVTASALDDLMGLCVVPTGIESEVRSFTARRIQATDEAVHGADLHSADAQGADSHGATRPRGRGARIALGSAGLALAIALSVWGAWGSPSERRGAVGSDGSETVAASAATDTEPPTDAEPSMDTAVSAEPTTPEAPEATRPEVLVPRSTAEPTDMPRPRTEASPRNAPRVENRSTSSEVATADRGWIRVGGRAVLGAEVVVDGQSRGHAPFEGSFPVGRHVVVVRRAGEPLLQQTVTLRATHTRAAALRLGS